MIINSIEDISKNLLIKVKAADQRVNKIVGYEANSISDWVNKLIALEEVEVGYRARCGSAHSTHKAYREFLKIIKIMEKEGCVVLQQPVKHKNAYATINGGFWNSSIFKLG